VGHPLFTVWEYQSNQSGLLYIIELLDSKNTPRDFRATTGHSEKSSGKPPSHCPISQQSHELDARLDTSVSGLTPAS